ncbi:MULTISPECIES: penicillin-binding protein 1B [unclassified Psychrobacter]|uniref:penicillin-binding protein 1B n=1 Tax=unclassified Psychrobacter TaxID=196806 RepID=UPI00078BA5DC|nr:MULTISPECIES: penicillin-binding protein 1B [unclassified Psychrobacter]AMN49870.1 penicillin-binding protein [Psychrobacter sp. P2G3]AMN67724.1 penicillin-binding protein [Psychrobacter sp. P11G5]
MQKSNLKLPQSSKSAISTLPSQQRGIVFSSILLIIVIVGMVLLALYLVKLDRTITQKFEGKRWDIPAKVYSQPLELYQGAAVDNDTMKKWLELLNYRSNKAYDRTGSFHKSGNNYFIHTRGFTYSANDVDKEQVIKMTIADNKIQTIQSTEQNKTGIIRLEPVNIGGIYPDSNEDRMVVSLDDVPQPLIDALIATEDRGFYEHKGVSIRGIARAVLNNFSGGSMQGGSTITQQLIKNFYLNSDRTLKRKANEALMAVLLELHYSKDEILQTYLNEIYLGQNGNRSINGFGLASQFYFNQPLNELRLDQQAMLVGMAKGPSVYNPRRHPNDSKARRDIVLNNMLEMGSISQEDYDKALEKPLGVVDKPVEGKSQFPDFLDIVKRELNEVYYSDDLKNEGLTIISTLDPIAQLAADKAVDKKLGELRRNSSKTKDLQGALVSANPETGELVAVVGSGSEFTGFNRAVDAKRQVGSLLKPVIYMTALESGRYNLASSVDDSPITVNLGDGTKWNPKNYDNRDHGYVPLTTALAKSYNQSTVRLGMEFGIDTFAKQLRRLGIEEKIPAYPSALLGSVNLSPMDMLGVYQVFATGGFRTPIHSIRTVIDDRGRILQRTGLNTQRSIPPETNYLTNYALQQVVKDGTAKRVQSLGSDLNLAGKTGTTNDYRDAWFAGYSGNYVSVVWVGRDDNKPIGLSGGTGALPVWVDYMNRLKLTPVSMPEPEGIEWLWLENNSGKLSNERCASARYLPVMSAYLPEEASSCAISLYQQDQARDQMQWQDEQGSMNQQRQREGLDIPNSEVINPNEENGDNGDTQRRTDTWYDRALEWF